MNARQLARVQRTTSLVDRANRFSSGEALNGALAWHVETIGDVIMLSGSNASNLQWFEDSLLVIVYIGARGGLKVFHCEGISPNSFK